MPDVYPSADVVARAIVAACKETGGDPIAVASGVRASPGRKWSYSVSRARSYAAYALREVHKGCGAQSIGRMVGAASADALLSLIDHNLRHNKAPWWDKAAVARVIAATRAMISSSLRDEGVLTTRRRPATDVINVTADLMGDPPPTRSALANRGSNP